MISQRADVVFWQHKVTLVKRSNNHGYFFSSTGDFHRQDSDRSF